MNAPRLSPLAPRPLARRPRRAYGIALVLIVSVVGGAFITLSVIGLRHVNERHARIGDRRVARGVIEGVVDRLALDAAAWLGTNELDRTWTAAGFEVSARLVPVTAPQLLVQDDAIGYRGVEISARPLDYPDPTEEEAARQRGRWHDWGLVRRYNVAAIVGQPPLFALVSEDSVQRNEFGTGGTTAAAAASNQTASEE